MREDSWLTAPAAKEQIFAPPDDLLESIEPPDRRLEKSLSMLNIKHVPANPSLN